MVKRRMAVVIILMCFCFCLSICPVMAASTSDASEPIDVNQTCMLTLSFTCDETAFEDVTVKLYKIAEVSSGFQYTLSSNFEDLGLVLNGIQTQGEWTTIRSTLEAYIIANDIKEDDILQTNFAGQVCFKNLKPALYLVIADTVKQDDKICCFDSALVSLPGLNADGIWQYQVNVASKYEIIAPSEKQVELKLIKLWKGDEGRNTRPKNIEVEIYQDGASYKNIILSQENNWSYSWTSKDDGSKWTVIEKSRPSGYTMTVEKRDDSFVLTNTYTSKNPDGPLYNPQTGDTFNIVLYVILLIVSGSLLIILGIIGKRNAHEKNN